jgi:adenylate cyclase
MLQDWCAWRCTLGISENKLSGRERMIAERYAQGETYKEVAEHLCIAPSTVRTHLAAIYRKLGVSSKLNLNSALYINSATELDSITAVTDKPSIAVLPFKNLSSYGNDKYFVQGFTEEVLTGLGRFREIVVISRQSSFLIDPEIPQAMESAQRLRVQYILEGSVRRNDKRVLITVKLIEGGSGHQIWSDQYDRVMEDMFDVQNEVAQIIVTMLVGSIEQSHYERSMGRETANLSAYECVLRGRYFLKDWHGTEHDIRQAQELFKQATKLDPRYAEAYAGLAATYIETFFRGWADTPEITGNKSIELALQAIALDQQNYFAHFVLSNGYWLVKGDFELAENQIKIAIELNPNYYWNYCYASFFSVCAGNLDASFEYGNEAMRRNPMLPDACFWTLSFTEYLSGRFDKAIAKIKSMTKIGPENYACLAACYAQLGLIREAKIAAAEFTAPGQKKTMTKKAWRSYWRSYLKFKDQEPVELLIDGLDKAGMVSY